MCRRESRPHPVVVGGNGQQVTFRYAARYADELNLVFLEPDEVRLALPWHASAARRGRDPATLRFSLYCRDADTRADGQARVDRLGAYAELASTGWWASVRWDTSEDGLASFAADCEAAGIALAQGELEAARG